MYNKNFEKKILIWIQDGRYVKPFNRWNKSGEINMFMNKKQS